MLDRFLVLIVALLHQIFSNYGLLQIVLWIPIPKCLRNHIIASLDQKHKRELLRRLEFGDLELFKYVLNLVEPFEITMDREIPLSCIKAIHESHHEYKLTFKKCIHAKLTRDDVNWLVQNNAEGNKNDLLLYCQTIKQIKYYHETFVNLTNPTIEFMKNYQLGLAGYALKLGYTVPKNHKIRIRDNLELIRAKILLGHNFDPKIFVIDCNYSTKIDSAEKLEDLIVLIKCGADIKKFTFSYRKNMKSSDIIEFIKLGYQVEYKDMFYFVTSRKRFDVIKEAIKSGYDTKMIKNGISLMCQVEQCSLRPKHKKQIIKLLE